MLASPDVGSDKELNAWVDEKAADVAQQAAGLEAALNTTTDLDRPQAQLVANALSTLFGAHEQLQDMRPDDQSGALSTDLERASRHIQSAVDELARAWIASVTHNAVILSSEPLVLTSPKLNMSINVTLVQDFTAQPVMCESSTGLPVAIEMPMNLLSTLLASNPLGESAAGAEFDPALPIGAVLYTSPINLHAAPRPPNNRTGSSTTISPTVSFKLMQDGKVLRVANAKPPINIHVPFAASNANALCVGVSANASCGTTVECRFWSILEQDWSTDGCAPVIEAGGTVSCLCDHLTEFIVFEFPTSSDELTALALSATEMRGLTLRALECALDPQRSWHSVPAVWNIMISLFSATCLLLANAICRDRREIRMILALLAGKKKQENRLRREKTQELERQRQLKRQQTQVRKQERRMKRQQSLHSTRLMRQQVLNRVLSRRSQSCGSLDVPSSPPPSPPSAQLGAHVETCTADEPSGASCSAATRAVGSPDSATASPTSIRANVCSAATMPQHTTAVHTASLGASSHNNTRRSSIGRASIRRASIAIEAGLRLSTQKQWTRTRHVVQAETVANRWHQDVDRVWKRLWMACTANHTFCAGVLYRGSAGFTRAQTVIRFPIP